jgi:hypothetical protein
MRSLNDSFLYRTLSGDPSVGKAPGGLADRSTWLDPSAFEEQFVAIERRFKNVTREAVLDAVRGGRIVVSYSPVKGVVRLPRMFPFVVVPAKTVGAEGHAAAIVNLTPFSTPERVNPRQIFALCESALIGIRASEDWEGVSNSPALTALGTQCFVGMSQSVLDVAYSIGLNKLRTDRVVYALAKYFMVALAGRPDGPTTSSRAMSFVRFGSSQEDVAGEVSSWPEDAFDGIDKFMASLATLPGLEAATARGFTNGWMRRYGEAAVLALEYWPFFAYAVIAADQGAGLINDSAVRTSAGEANATAFYNSLVKTITR